MYDDVYSVSQVNKLIKALVEGERRFANIQVRGEISNFKRYSSGHCYFTLKDAGGVLKAVMFKTAARTLRFEPQNGDTVIAVGRISVYERDGVYQLYTDLMIPEGTGDLMLAFEQLKQKLLNEGLFDESRKKQLPVNPKTVGIITSPSGAAVRDLITVSRRRAGKPKNSWHHYIAFRRGSARFNYRIAQAQQGHKAVALPGTRAGQRSTG